MCLAFRLVGRQATNLSGLGQVADELAGSRPSGWQSRSVPCREVKQSAGKPVVPCEGSAGVVCGRCPLRSPEVASGAERCRHPRGRPSLNYACSLRFWASSSNTRAGRSESTRGPGGLGAMKQAGLDVPVPCPVSPAAEPAPEERDDAPRSVKPMSQEAVNPPSPSDRSHLPEHLPVARPVRADSPD